MRRTWIFSIFRTAQLAQRILTKPDSLRREHCVVPAGSQVYLKKLQETHERFRKSKRERKIHHIIRLLYERAMPVTFGAELSKLETGRYQEVVGADSLLFGVKGHNKDNEQASGRYE